MKMPAASATASAVMLMGCASGGAQINSRTVEPRNDPIQKVLVFFNAKSPHFTGALYTTFVAATRRRLESCGLTVSSLEFDPLEIDMKAKFAKAMAQANPDAVLLFVRNGGNLVTGSGGVSGSLYFDVEARDTKKAAPLWKARIDYRTLTQNMFTDDTQSAERFALQFTSRLAPDRLSSNCPAERVTPKT